MDFPSLLADYGYLAIFLGSLIEGESLLLLGGIAAAHDHLSLPLVILCAFLGGVCVDQTWFWVGRRFGTGFLERRPRWRRKVARMHRLLERHRIVLVLSYRFLYGLRTVCPFVMGTSRISAPFFVLANLGATALWATAFATAGWAFGEKLLPLILGMGSRERWLVLALTLLIVAALLNRRLRHPPLPKPEIEAEP